LKHEEILKCIGVRIMRHVAESVQVPQSVGVAKQAEQLTLAQLRLHSKDDTANAYSPNERGRLHMQP